MSQLIPKNETVINSVLPDEWDSEFAIATRIEQVTSPTGHALDAPAFPTISLDSLIPEMKGTGEKEGSLTEKIERRRVRIVMDTVDNNLAAVKIWIIIIFVLMIPLIAVLVYLIVQVKRQCEQQVDNAREVSTLAGCSTFSIFD